MGAYDAWDTYKDLRYSFSMRTQGTKTCPKLSIRNLFMSLPSNKDAAADQYKKDAWKVLKSLNTTNGQLSLNFQVAQPQSLPIMSRLH